MKKYYLLLICAFFIAIGMSAQTAELKMANGQTLKGTLIDATDTTVIFWLQVREFRRHLLFRQVAL